MKYRLTISFLLLTTTLLVPGNLSANVLKIRNDTLTIGSPAPSLDVGKWIKGEPVASFDPNFYYVIEFSGVSCAPCRASIPHLSEIAEKYRSILKIVSIYIFENGAYPPRDTLNTSYMLRVERFINKMSEKIKFNVAVDNPKQTCYENWMRSAQRPGIPAVFLVDRKGSIDWIGHPAELEKNLIKLDSTFAGLSLAPDNGTPPFSETINYLQKFGELLKSDEKEAYPYAKRMLEGPLKDNEPNLYYMARDIVYSSPILAQPDFDVALSLVERAISLSVDDILTARMMSLKSDILQKTGNHLAARTTLIIARDKLNLFQSEARYATEINKINKKLERLEN